MTAHPGQHRGMRLQLRPGGEKAFLDMFASANQGAVLIDLQGCVQHMNAIAESLVGDVIIVVDGRIEAFREDDRDKLRRAVFAKLGSGEPEGRSGVAVLRSSSGHQWAIQVRGMKRTADTEGMRGALLLIHDLDRMPEAALPALAQAFGFSPTEAKVAVKLASGETVAEIAHTHEVSLATVRSQLASIFDKTNTSRQAELVNLLNRVLMLAR